MTNKLRLSRIQILGLVLFFGGLALLIGGGARAVTKSRQEPRSFYPEISEEEQESSPSQEAKKQISLTAPIMILGAVLIMASVPCFYLPWAEPELRHKIEDDEDDLEDEEFDYPDDDYDFILDDKVRKKLIKERNRKIKEKQKRLKRKRRRRHK